jgi:hypothetical protein
VYPYNKNRPLPLWIAAFFILNIIELIEINIVGFKNFI